MSLQKPNPTVQGGAGNDMLSGASQFPDSNIDWRTQLIASRHLIPKNIAPTVIALALGEAEQ
ncbi:MAG: hypothetical protein HQ482_04495 [Sphingomonadales bacterium]|nr:hypothetical protein [Sphingomonadales bacterium]